MQWNLFILSVHLMNNLSLHIGYVGSGSRKQIGYSPFNTASTLLAQGPSGPAVCYRNLAISTAALTPTTALTIVCKSRCSSATRRTAVQHERCVAEGAGRAVFALSPPKVLPVELGR